MRSSNVIHIFGCHAEGEVGKSLIGTEFHCMIDYAIPTGGRPGGYRLSGTWPMPRHQ